MEIIETAPFARRRDELFGEEQFRRLEEHLVLNPAAGARIPGGRGLRRSGGWVQGAASGAACV